jgi:hypothetical protein
MRLIFAFRFSTFNCGPTRWLAGGITAAIALAIPVAAQAQGCAMCYTSASAAKKAGMEALQNGVFILLFPPLLLFAAILWQTFHRRSVQEVVEMESGLAPKPCGLTPLD